MYDRKSQNSVKQLSFNKKNFLIKKKNMDKAKCWKVRETETLVGMQEYTHSEKQFGRFS